ncbi:[FeFe] hydrogenase H-cluster maturation GTPase HydF [Parvimonas sp. G1425]|uniref:[FeFe] hydrogenase H-cluster maturation GTPase HydF n=1 Tax=Parvimonas sp. G1425 TaxID=3387694 RepID=UPI0039E6F7C6
MQTTPNANRIHIAFFGKTNVGKSSLINAIANQTISLVSKQKGTTTDPVKKAIEIHPIGPCLLIDTAGFDDDSILGNERIELTKQVIEQTDIAVLLFGDNSFEKEREWINYLEEKNIPIIFVINKSDIVDSKKITIEIEKEFKKKPICVSALNKENLDILLKEFQNISKDLEKEESICAHLVKPLDTVLLVMPQDIQAPKGRLILPQVQTIRDLLDNKCIVISTTFEQFDKALESLTKAPNLIITDSQLFAKVFPKKPKNSLLTSFSVLFSKYKGDIEEFIRCSQKLDSLDENSKVLIAEACAHKPLKEDIGRVKLPRLLRKKIHPDLKIDIVSGNDFPKDLSHYDVIIHCGACMFNKKHVMNRVEQAINQKIPITNYGIAIAKLNGILEYIDY